MSYDYKEQIKRLTAHPETIPSQWFSGLGLFKFASDGSSLPIAASTLSPGCPTQIRLGGYAVVINGKINEELTAAIRADERIPTNVSDITIESLPTFEEHQIAIDNAILKAEEEANAKIVK